MEILVPNFSEGEERCVLCGEVVDGFRAEHRGEKPPQAGVSRCKYLGRIKTLEDALGDAIGAIRHADHPVASQWIPNLTKKLKAAP